MHAVVAALQVRLAFTAPGGPGAPLPLVGGGEQPDWAGTAWTWWWVVEALRAGEPVLEAGRNYHPVGQWPLAWFNIVDALVFGPFLHLFGPRVGYNLACGSLLVSNGLAAGVLVRAAGGSSRAALVGGLLVQTSAFVSTELLQGRAGQAWVAPVLIALAGLFWALERGGRGRAVGAGVLVALSGYAYWFYGLFVAFAGGVLALVGSASRRRRLETMLVGGSAALAMVLPAAVLLAGTWSGQPGVLGTQDPVVAAEPLARGQQSLAFAIRTAHWPLWPVLDAPGDLSDKRLHPVGLLLAALGAWPKTRHRAAVVGIVAVGYLLTLGPYARGWTGATAFPLPWLFLHDWLPFFSRLWWPERAEVLVLAGLCILAGWGLDRIAWRPRVTAVVASAALLITGHLTLPAGPLPSVDRALYAPLDGALLTVPLMADDDHGRKLLWAQVHHGHTVSAGLGDHLPGHRPADFEQGVAGNTLLGALHALSTGAAPAATVVPEDVAALREQGFSWVVADAVGVRPGLEGRWLAAWRRRLRPVFGPPAVVRPGGLAWRIVVPSAAVTVPAQPAVEAGIRDQQLAPLHRRGARRR